MKLDAKSRAAWQQAQEAEKGHWAWLWQDENSLQRQQLIDSETIKAEFLFDEMLAHFNIDPQKDWAGKRVLDVGCGPISVVARHRYGKTRAGVDPLRYPRWVYEDYAKHDFKVHLVPFEELPHERKYDVIIFYNALQHFADLDLVAQTCKHVLSKKGVVYLCEYLKVPTNEAHIQFLEKHLLDETFAKPGLSVESAEKTVRLTGFVERPGGLPIDIYLARMQNS